MVLDALGIQIGPLLAGAGVVGIAIGFGAQTLVKDIISGVFYLLDDAFRVGEYIQAGSHKGTVESFSLRSVKLRHHRGPISTVPFGELGAVQNISRDWVIDKITIGVHLRHRSRQGEEADQADRQGAARTIPSSRRNIIETLKMQGVEQMGDFAIQIAPEDDDPAGRAVRHPPPRLRPDQEGVRRERHQVRLPDGAGRRRRAARTAVTAAAQQAFEMTRPPAPAEREDGSQPPRLDPPDTARIRRSASARKGAARVVAEVEHVAAGIDLEANAIGVAQRGKLVEDELVLEIGRHQIGRAVHDQRAHVRVERQRLCAGRRTPPARCGGCPTSSCCRPPG